ncbi:MAG: Ig-like domain-containing protein, partial [Clostridia bacterium]|nr:Ig-like domain-containing protein [Clostridia bacterium]
LRNLSKVTLEPNSSYVLSLWTKGPSIRLVLSAAKLNDITLAGGQTQYNTTESTDEWKEMTVEFTTGTNPSWDNNYTMYLRRFTNATEDTYVDNITLVKKAAPDAEAIAITPNSIYLLQGASQTLTVNPTPTNATAGVVTWTSSDASIVTVDQTGKVTAVAKTGTVTITATNDKGLTATSVVNVVSDAESITIPSGNVEVLPNSSVTLAVKGVPVGSNVGTLTWTSSDTAIATVDQTGTVTAVAESGTATITVSNDKGKSTSVTVTVSKYANILPNGDLELGAAGIVPHLPADGVSVEDGVGIDGTQALKFDKDVSPAITYIQRLGQVKLEPNSRYILSLWTKGPSIRLVASTAKLKDITFVDGNYMWSTADSDNEWKELVVVFDTGASPAFDNNYSFYLRQFTAGVGADTYVDNITLVRQPEAESITIAPSVMDLLPDDTATLMVSSAPLNSNVGAVTWSSSNENIVSVSQDGVITALAASGTVTITATTAKGLTATCTVTINEYGNLLKNGDFEQLAANWDAAAKNNIKPGIGKDGSYGLELVNPTTGKDNSTFYKLPLSVLPATTYEISFDYLATPNAQFHLWSSRMALQSPTKESGDGTEWKHASQTFTTPADMTLNPGWDFSIVSRVEGDTPAVIDNVCLRLYNSGVEAESIKFNKDKVAMVPGRTETLAIMATPFGGDVNQSVWASSDENVATVEYGVVTAVGKGTATITATTKNGKIATCKVTVSGEEALVKNGTFDTKNDDSWRLSGGAVLEDGKGRVNSTAAVLTNGATVEQSVTLQPNATYLLSFRYRSTAGYVTAKLTNGEAVLLEKKTDTLNQWKQVTYEFTTPEVLTEEASLLTLTTDGAGPIYLDNVFLAQKASLVDFVVKDIIWDGGEEQVITGTELLFAVTIANEGADPVPAGSVIEVDIAISGEVVRTLTYTCTTAMASGEMAIVMDTEPWAATEGAHVVSARANPRLSILEMNSANNAYQVHLRAADELLAAPEKALQAGMDKLIFSDEFDSIDTIDAGATGLEYYKWYVTRQWGDPTVARDAYDVEDGILTIKDGTSSYGITLTTVDVNTHNGFAWNKGYLEVRMCIPTPRDTYGGSVTVWSFPLTKLYETEGENNKWVEMDWLEFWGNTEDHPDGYWTVTLHDQEKNMETGEVTFWARNTNASIDAMGDKQWHTMGWLWDENIIQAYMDGEKMFEITYSEDGLPNPFPAINKGDIREGIFSQLNEQVMCLFLGGDDEVPLLVDYVRIWQGEGGGMTPDGGNDEEIIDIEAEGFWYNYCTDDWGDPIAEVTEENYQNVLKGQELWEQLSDERKAEINALLEEYGQPTYDKLLTDALIIAEGGTPDGEEPGTDSPDTGEGARTLPAAIAVVALSAAALWATRKRRKV